jgi:hypothetical protein
MNRSIVANAVLFQLGWFACILGGNVFAIPAAAIILICHWFFISRDIAEWRSIFIIAFAGSVIDSILFSTYVFIDGSDRYLAPLWLICLWLIFATTPNYTFRWLQKRTIVSVVLGAVAGPLSYLAGIKLNAVEFGIPSSQALLLLGVIWAIFFPVSLWLAAVNRNFGSNVRLNIR